MNCFFGSCVDYEFGLKCKFVCLLKGTEPGGSENGKLTCDLARQDLILENGCDARFPYTSETADASDGSSGIGRGRVVCHFACGRFSAERRDLPWYESPDADVQCLMLVQTESGSKVVAVEKK